MQSILQTNSLFLIYYLSCNRKVLLKNTPKSRKDYSDKKED